MKRIATLPKDEVAEILKTVKAEKRDGLLIVSFSKGTVSGNVRWLESAEEYPLALESLLAVD